MPCTGPLRIPQSGTTPRAHDWPFSTQAVLHDVQFLISRRLTGVLPDDPAGIGPGSPPFPVGIAASAPSRIQSSRPQAAGRSCLVLPACVFEFPRRPATFTCIWGQTG